MCQFSQKSKIFHHICFDGCVNACILDSKTSFLHKCNNNMTNKKLLQISSVSTVYMAVGRCSSIAYVTSILKDKHDCLFGRGNGSVNICLFLLITALQGIKKYQNRFCWHPEVVNFPLMYNLIFASPVSLSALMTS